MIGPDPKPVQAEPTDVVIVAPPVRDIEELDLALQTARITTRCVHDPDLIARAVVGGRPGVVVIDLRAGDALGERMLMWVTGHGNAGVITITLPEQVDARLRALQLGAEDHLLSPFDVREASARAVAALARRENGSSESIVAGDLTILPSQRAVERAGEHVPLTPREMALIRMLNDRAGEAVSKPELLAAVWGGQTRTENVVEANVSSLRRKLHRLGPPVIHTVHRSGYVFRPTPISVVARRNALVAHRDKLVAERSDIVARRDELLAKVRSEREPLVD